VSGGDALRAERVGVSFSTGRGAPVSLVHHLELRLGAREVMGIVGETGAGKTLSMKAILGLLPPGVWATGSVSIDGQPSIDLTHSRALAAQRGRDIGIVLQNPAGMFDPLIRVKHQLVEGVVRHGLLKRKAALRRASELLDSMRFSDVGAVLELYPHQLSGGMAQRVAIAMALMPQPTVIVADEPTSALDAHIRVEALELLRRVAREQDTAIILVSHDLGLVSHFSDQIAVMYAGRVVENGPTEIVLADPQHPYTRALLRCSPALDVEPRVLLEVIAGVPPLTGEPPDGCPFAPRCPLAFERCRHEHPALRSSGERSAACHLAFEQY